MPRTINEGFEEVALADLKPQPRNANQGDFGAIQESVEANGFYGAIVANRRTSHILVGNHRYQVAKSLGFSTVPVIWVDVDEEEELRIMLADNRTARLGADNEAALAELLAELAQTPSGLAGTGFDGDDLDQLIIGLAAGNGTPEPGGGGDDFDATPAEAGPTRCQSGDLWRIGPHRLLCGDSTKPEDVARLMDGERACCLFTDPPYNTGIQQGRTASAWGVIENDAMSPEAFESFLRAVAAAVLPHVDGDRYLCCDYRSYSVFERVFGVPRSCIVWAKNNFGLGVGFRRKHEFIVYYGDYNGTTESDLWEEAKVAGSEYQHPTEKPVGLPARALECSSQSRDIVLDAFCGSGTTLIAAHRSGRICCALELTPRYCDVILRRAEAEGIGPIELVSGGSGDV